MDALLKRFAKERAAKEAELDGLRKKRAEIEAKAAKLREQLGSLADQEQRSQQELAEMDAQRDREVSQLLASLGVQLREPPRAHRSQQGQPHPAGDGGQAVRDRVTKALAERRGEQN
ncbi:MAG: hypothetical protein GTO53_00605 [Planctomycetales bacterium]|nr:hypothetical protein [Planctomycetales bacterium]NIM07681.1 hypothetical protein [Planctomycetales bacterium]NIN07184.1 hypothetical protein [Planctomycetales bacterium]NIN76277.1 hypothetical protein [Planctomycetales bacterium]NIO33483.1 hypothetical protein [Planctomycetales bacterium]